jgi:hypothetical protein
MTHKETLTYWSISLEMAAFFLIAFDLYGERRLRILRVCIRKFKPNLLVKIVIGILTIIIFTTIAEMLFHNKGIRLFDIYGLLLGWFILDIVKIISKIFISFCLLISRKFPIKGVLSFIGAIIFIISKIIAIYCV